jgi:hypothetical protein
MNYVRLQVLYDPPDARTPLVVAEVTSFRAIRDVMRVAISDAGRRSQEEADFLRQSTAILVPGIED